MKNRIPDTPANDPTHVVISALKRGLVSLDD